MDTEIFRLRNATAILSFLVLCCSAVHAQSVLFTSAYVEDPAGQSITQAAETQKFTLASTSTITGIDFTGITDVGATAISTNWAILPGTFTPSSAPFMSFGLPGDSAIAAPVLNSFITTVPINYDGDNNPYAENINADSISVPSIVLGPGTYYLAMDNAVASNAGTPSPNGQVYWLLNTGGSTGDYQYNSSPATFGYNGSLAFSILGKTGSLTTPEPSTLVVLMIGFVGLGAFIVVKSAPNRRSSLLA